MGSHSAGGGRPSNKADRRAWRKARAARRRAGRRVPSPVFLAVLYGPMAVEAGRSNHVGAGDYLLSLLCWIVLVIAAAAIDNRAERRAPSLTRRRPRWQYLALAVSCLAPVAGEVLLLVHAHGRPPSWWTNSSIEQAAANLGIFVVTCCLLSAVVMLGRAVAWGRMRQRFWQHPPRWLADQLKRATGASARQTYYS